MIWQFDHCHGEAKYWIDEKVGRQRIIGTRSSDDDQQLDYQSYRLAFREIASSTNERGFVACILPRRVFANHKLMLSTCKGNATMLELLFALATFNSFAFDYLVRQRTTTTVSMFTFYQLPAPRLTSKDKAFEPIVQRAARLICTAPEFDDLAKEVGLKGYEDGVTDADERSMLRAELDGLITHLYGLTEDEFAHILTTFPIVPEPVKAAAMEAFKAFAPKSADTQLLAEITAGESAGLEFKSSARWDFKENRINKALEQVILKTCAAFLNTDGGALLIGVDDDGKVVGLERDYKTLGKKRNRDAMRIG